MVLEHQALKETCLAERHAALGARLVPFAGWRMPVQYTGILEEHQHTRSAAGLFDTCHMGELVVHGPEAEQFLEHLVTCRVGTLARGQARYGLLLDERGGVIDDLIVFRNETDEFLVVVNAGTRDKDRDWIQAHLPPADVTLLDISDATAKLDLQGPQSSAVLGALVGEQAIADLRRFHFFHNMIDWVAVVISRTGYTGEVGYELFCSVADAPRLWDRLLAFEGVKPIGLGARDTLRLEKGLPLYGHELDGDHTPLEAGLERFIDFEKDFIGKEALLAQKQAGLTRVLTGFVCEGRRAAREGFEVRVDGRAVGRVSSGAFSPDLKRGIGMCYLEPALAVEGQAIALTDGRLEIKAEVKKPPFV